MQNLVGDEDSSVSNPASPNTPHSPSPTLADDREARLAAIQNRLTRRPPADDSDVSGPFGNPFEPFDLNHEKRQEFRRLIDPGILRVNRKDQAMVSLQTLLTIAENILREPDNPKYKTFKPTNTIIKKNLVDPKGTLEYAVALGFRDEIRNFQPYYVFKDKFMPHLRTGAAILREVMEIEIEKQRREDLQKARQKEEEEARVEKAKRAFMDDRKSKSLRDELSRQARRDVTQERSE